ADIEQKERTELAGKLNEGKAAAINQAVASGLAAPKLINTLNTLEASSKIGGKDIFRGPGSDFALKASQFLVDRGWATETKALQKLPYAKLIQKLNAELAAMSTHAFTNRGTNFDLMNFMRNNPGIMQSQAGMEMLIDILRQEHTANIAIGKMAQKIKPNDL